MNHLFKILILSIILGAILPSAKAQKTDTAKKNLSTVVLPVVYFTPETRLAGGVALLNLFSLEPDNPNTSKSSTQFGLVFTQERQFLAYLPYQLFLDDDKVNIYGELGYYIYSYLYFGEGNRANPADPDVYGVNYPRARIHAVKKLNKNISLGGLMWYENHEVADLSKAPILREARPNGVEGGEVFGFGPIARFDSRDDVYYPSKGWFVEVKSVSSFAKPLIVQSRPAYGFTRVLTDVTRYQNLNKAGVLAINLTSENLWGDVPFFLSAFMGGPNKFRGYYFGRYRDNHFHALQTEYRFPIYKRLKGSAFGHAGRIASSLGAFADAPMRYGGGAGLRFQLSKDSKLNVRLDYALTQEGGALYLTFGEAF